MKLSITKSDQFAMSTIMHTSKNLSINQFNNKKIGIWGFGVVGQSALTYFDQQNVAQIEILNSTEVILPATKTPTIATVQTEQSIQNFLESNDFILTSPGIPLHDYQQFAHKFISELDLYQQHKHWPTIAITGSLGKTTITHLLTNILQQSNLQAVAAGNIGYPMLSLLTESEINKNYDAIVLELSSFQLQQTKTFAPDLAIITNIYPNHLDHHKDMQEYQESKHNIFRRQNKEEKNKNQIALLPVQLLPFEYDHFFIRSHWAFFSATKPTTQELQHLEFQHVYYLENKFLFHIYEDQIQQLFDLSTLPSITFDANWLIIIAACHLYKIDLATIAPIVQNLALPDHRVQKVGSYQGSNFYNDSKSTVWQATLQAVISMGNKPIKLFLGGLSKGADRTPLFKALADKNIEIYIFGQEADHLAQLCKQFNISHQIHHTLDAAWQACIENLHTPHELLFSPGGSSFDLFQDYKARGQYFTNLVQQYCSKSTKPHNL